MDVKLVAKKAGLRVVEVDGGERGTAILEGSRWIVTVDDEHVGYRKGYKTLRAARSGVSYFLRRRRDGPGNRRAAGGGGGHWSVDLLTDATLKFEGDLQGVSLIAKHGTGFPENWWHWGIVASLLQAKGWVAAPSSDPAATMVCEKRCRFVKSRAGRSSSDVDLMIRRSNGDPWTLIEMKRGAVRNERYSQHAGFRSDLRTLGMPPPVTTSVEMLHFARNERAAAAHSPPKTPGPR
jgi:hypothetical protein